MGGGITAGSGRDQSDHEVHRSHRDSTVSTQRVGAMAVGIFWLQTPCHSTRLACKYHRPLRDAGTSPELLCPGDGVALGLSLGIRDPCLILKEAEPTPSLLPKSDVQGRTSVTVDDLKSAGLLESEFFPRGHSFFQIKWKGVFLWGGAINEVLGFREH